MPEGGPPLGDEVGEDREDVDEPVPLVMDDPYSCRTGTYRQILHLVAEDLGGAGDEQQRRQTGEVGPQRREERIAGVLALGVVPAPPGQAVRRDQRLTAPL